MDLKTFNQYTPEEAQAAFYQCCGSTKWAKLMTAKVAFETEEELYESARQIWYEECQEADYLEAFEQHPQIGDLESLEKKFASTAKLAGGEQASVKEARQEILEQLAQANADYKEKFGFIFIVCATGKSAEEMLQLLQIRLQHNRTEELAIAHAEQFKITLIRLHKQLELSHPIWTKNSQITTHVLDTAIGKPGAGMAIKLRHQVDGVWHTKALGITDNDGRIADLLPPGVKLAPGVYEMYFHTGDYYAATNQKGFYPAVSIYFETFDQTHYHVPLLLNPFGYSTYRGS